MGRHRRRSSLSTPDLVHANPRNPGPHLRGPMGTGHVYCICGQCGAYRSGQRRWTLVTIADARRRPTFNYANAALFQSKRQRKELAKGRRKGEAVRGTCITGRDEETKVLFVSNCAEDSAASFNIGRVSHPGTVRTQPMSVAKMHGHILVDASNSSALTQQFLMLL